MNDEMLEYLKQILSRLDGIESRLDDMRTEIGGQFQMMNGNTSRVDGLERIVAAQENRITRLERTTR